MPDIRIEFHGTVHQYIPETERGLEWLRSQLHTESWQWLGNTVVIDRRASEHLMELIATNDLEETH